MKKLIIILLTFFLLAPPLYAETQSDAETLRSLLKLFNMFITVDPESISVPQRTTGGEEGSGELGEGRVGQLTPPPDDEQGRVTANPGVVFYCQGNSRWQQGSLIDLGGTGCGPTSIAMIMSSFGVPKSPTEIGNEMYKRCLPTGEYCSEKNPGTRLHTGGESYMQDTLSRTNFMQNMGFHVGPNITNGSVLDLQKAQEYIKNGFLILASSHLFPCANCKNAKFISHIFVVDNVNINSLTVSIRDPNNCSYSNKDDENPNRIAFGVSSFPWAYAFPIKKL